MTFPRKLAIAPAVRIAPIQSNRPMQYGRDLRANRLTGYIARRPTIRELWESTTRVGR